jgi:hypothetical protein
MLIIEDLNENSKEIWRDVVGYEGLYQVSSMGRVKSLERKIYHKSLKRKIYHKIYPEKILVQRKDKDDYFRVNLSSHGKTKTYRVNRLVAEAFIPNRDNLPVVDHIDSNRTNNRVTNLRWATVRQNSRNPNSRAYGGRHPSAKKVLNLDTKQVFDTVGGAALAFGTSHGSITRAALTGGKCAGCHWSYYEG